MAPKKIHIKLLNWFDKHGRHDLPWQNNITPYRVWVSEIMLQQTQVATVIPYYKNFIKKFNTIKKLAEADLDSVLSLWSGLGYYSRARNLHKTAQIINQKYNNKFPNDLESLVNLPGIGKSTAGAILAISHNKPIPILDGNVKRVLCRLHAIDTWPGEKNTENYLWELAEFYTPKNRPADYTQAIMDLGATVCTRTKPDCKNCPLNKNCIAYKNNTSINYPIKKPKKIIPTRQTYFLVYKTNNKILLIKRPSEGIWGGLWSLPECDDLKNLENKSIKLSKPLTHIFTHFKLNYQVVLINIKERDIYTIPNSISFTIHQALKLGLPAPIRKIIENLKEKKYDQKNTLCEIE